MRAKLNDLGRDDVTITPGSSGQFDVVIDGALVFSRKSEGRFPEDADVGRWFAPT